MYKQSGLRIIVVATVFLSVVACTGPLSGSLSSTIKLTIDSSIQQTRSIGPAISTDVDSYVIAGSADHGDTFEQTTAETQLSFEGLRAGYWNLTVDAFNASGVHLYTGSTRVLVHQGSVTSVSVTLVPVDGTGTLEVLMEWPVDSVTTPRIDASLTPAAGPAVEIPFTISGSTARFESSAVGSGYHTLVTRLYDDDVLMAGAVELVQIVGSHVTTAHFVFDAVNQPGSLQVGIQIAPEFAESLTITITGGDRTAAYGTSVPLTGAVDGSPGSTVFTWYVNGAVVDAGTTAYTLSGTAPGTFRVDLVVLSADGSEGGTATSIVTIAEPTP